MMQRTGRLTCPRCGANNFETVTACWKCGTALNAGVSSPVAAAPLSQGAYPGAERAPAPPMTTANNAPYPLAPVSSAGDSGVATRAAIALALTLPWIGLPVGWVFMMIEDRRRQAIGRICAVWSMIGLVLHLLLLIPAASAVGAILMKAVMSGAMRGGGNGGVNLPDSGGVPGTTTP